MNEPAFLSAKELAIRWRLNSQTLANWRHAGKGPPFIRVGARVLYPIEAIRAFEKISPAWLGSTPSTSTLHHDPV